MTVPASPGATTWEPACWVNGLRVDPRAPALSVSDRGFTLADGCFETMRAYAGVIFRLNEHIARLADTAERLAIPVPAHLEETISDAARMLSEHRADASVRLTLSRGVGGGLAVHTGQPPTTVMLVDRLPPFPQSIQTRGISVRVGHGRRNEFASTAGLKTLAYTDAILALAQARERGADDALLLDTEGHLSEGSTSNVFLVSRGVVCTPPRSCGALPGITRDAVLEILGSLNVPIDHAPIPSAALDVADEIFLTSSLRGIAPVTAVDDRPVGAGHVGPLTRRIQQGYDHLVADAVADCAV